MINAGEISETAYRVLDYWMQQESQEAVQQRLAKMAAEKYQAVQEMLKIVITPHCMRQQLVQYFGQILTKQHAVCCTNCGLDIATIIESRKIEKQIELMNWEERLQKLLFGHI